MVENKPIEWKALIDAARKRGLPIELTHLNASSDHVAFEIKGIARIGFLLSALMEKLRETDDLVGALPPELVFRLTRDTGQLPEPAVRERNSLPTQLRNPKLNRPPGNRLLMLSEFVFSMRKFETVLLPTIVDMRNEYFEALAAGRTWKARWIIIRGHWSFWAAVGMDIPISALGMIKKNLDGGELNKSRGRMER